MYYKLTIVYFPQNKELIYKKPPELFLKTDSLQSISQPQVCATVLGSLSPVKVKVKVAQLNPTLCNPMEEPARLLCPWNSPGQNTGVASLSLL